MERTTEFLSTVIHDRMREAALDRLAHEARLAARACHGSWRRRLGERLVRFGARLAGGTAELRPARIPC